MPVEEPSSESLSTERLTLRKPRLEDANEIFALRSNAEVNRYIDRKPAITIEDAIEFLRNIVRGVENGGSQYWAICLTESGELVGTICLFDYSPDRQVAEIGYELLPFYQHKGIMQEAISAVLHYGFRTLNLETITAFPSADNESSVRLLVKNNFVIEEDGVDRDNYVRYVLHNSSRRPVRDGAQTL
jgi:ribosomal-protein-alanine N-acetyltransferase